MRDRSAPAEPIAGVASGRIRREWFAFPAMFLAAGVTSAQSPWIVPESTWLSSATQSTTPVAPSTENVVEVSRPDPTLPIAAAELAVPQNTSAGMLDVYRGRVLDQPDWDAAGLGGASVPGIDPDDPLLWWQSELRRPLGLASQVMAVDVNWLTQTALQSSPYVRSLLIQPTIERTSVVIADAEFDPTVYLQGKFVDTNEPIGSILTTGRLDGRYLDQTFGADGGVLKKMRAGGNLTALQRGGFQANNSQFLLPNPQGTTRLELNYAQPLLRDRGVAVNQVRVVLANIDVRLTQAEIRGELEQHLADVTQTYWDLYQARAVWLQRTRLLRRAEELRAILQARGDYDATKRQMLRADAAVAVRRTGLRRAEANIRDLQSRLRVLTGSDLLQSVHALELTPEESPPDAAIAISVRDATIMAFENRHDLTESLQQIHATGVKVGVARNQILPRLDMLLSSYVAGLDSRRDTLGAFVNQFGQGGLSYAAGLRYERPVGNRAAQARLHRNKLELTRLMEEFRQRTESAITEVEIAVRETQTAYAELLAKHDAIAASVTETDYLLQRLITLPQPQESSIVLIEDLLNSQERVFDSEREFVSSQVAYAMSWVDLRRAMGVLLRITTESVSPAAEFGGDAEPMTPDDADDASTWGTDVIESSAGQAAIVDRPPASRMTGAPETDEGAATFEFIEVQELHP